MQSKFIKILKYVKYFLREKQPLPGETGLFFIEKFKSIGFCETLKPSLQVGFKRF